MLVIYTLVVFFHLALLYSVEVQTLYLKSGQLKRVDVLPPLKAIKQVRLNMSINYICYLP